MLPIRYLALIFIFYMPFAHSNEPLRIGLTPVFVDHQGAFIREWQSYLSHKLEQPVEFVQRASYQDIMQLLLDGRINAAWICGYPYVRHQNQLELLVSPSYQGEPLYRAYIIVPSTDTETQTIEDLQGKIFAYSDPNSNSGYLFPRFLIWQTGLSEPSFFSRSFFTGSHNNVVDAVASGLAQGGAVDGYVWESLLKTHPELAEKTRVIIRSEQYGHPPIVSHTNLNSQTKQALTQAFTQMSETLDGKKLLEKLNLDGFVLTSPERYSDIESMMFILGEPTHLFIQD